MRETKKTIQPNKYDFFAIAMLIASIIMLYISFVKFNELSKSVTGADVSEISDQIKLQVQDAITKINTIPLEELTFVQYVWNSIQTFSCSIVESQTDKIKNIITETLSSTIYNFKEIAEQTCMPRTELITEGLYSVTTSYTGNIDIGKVLNSIVQTASVVSTPQTTSSCITNTALSLQKNAIEQLFHQKTLILNKLSAQSSQAISFLTYGAQMGTTSILYIIYRSKDVMSIAYDKLKRVNRGGRKTIKKRKKSRKFTKKYKKYKKYKKSNKVNKKPKKNNKTPKR